MARPLSDFSLDAEDFRRLADDWLITLRARGRSRDGVDIDDRFYLRVAIREGLILRWQSSSAVEPALRFRYRPKRQSPPPKRRRPF